jgi:hypothetical protein
MSMIGKLPNSAQWVQPKPALSKRADSVDKKLREAEFFLTKMREQEDRPFGDKEPFDFYLSAFLSAARSVDYRLRYEQKATYKPWREQWNGAHREEDALIKFFVGDRRIEVHESGSGRNVKRASIPVRGQYSDASGTVQASSTPLALAVAYDVAPGERDALIMKPAYFFTVEGTERKATDACAEYLALLRQMAAEFMADYP